MTSDTAQVIRETCSEQFEQAIVNGDRKRRQRATLKVTILHSVTSSLSLTQLKQQR
jgi:hypothetical protein